MELSDATPATPGIDPGTFRLVAQCLNHYASPGIPQSTANYKLKCNFLLWLNYVAQIEYRNIFESDTWVTCQKY
jgi:hypothetical protein